MAADSNSHSNSNGLRRDVLTNRQVILATQRSDRPIRVTSTPSSDSQSEDPFLQGNEHSTPNERLALRRRGTSANSEGWLLRVVPNRYPAVNPLTVASVDALSKADSLAGIHDVIIECPDHRTMLSELSEVEVARILIAWQTRCHQIAGDGQFRFLNIFRNEGFGAGASLPHCHSQLLATNLSTSTMKTRLAAERKYQSHNSGTLFQKWLNDELADGSRVVGQTKSFAVVCPFASRMSWQIRVCPTANRLNGFADLALADLCELGAVLLSVTHGLSQIAQGVAFNITLTLPPLDTPAAFPWMLDVLPRPSRIAGFELMTDVDILTTSPEVSAQLYRQCINWRTACRTDEVCPDGFQWC